MKNGQILFKICTKKGNHIIERRNFFCAIADISDYHTNYFFFSISRLQNFSISVNF